MTVKVLPLFFILILPLRSSGQPAEYDFLHALIRIAPDPETGSVGGTVRYQFQNTGSPDSLYLDAHNMEFSSVELDGKPAAFSTTSSKLIVKAPHKAGKHELYIAYRATPRQGVYFLGWKDSLQGNEQIWTQGQGKGSSHWVPVVDQMEEKVEFDITVLFEPGYQVIANGLLIENSREGASNRWVFDMDRPMSSYLLAFAIGQFDALSLESGSGVPLKGYYPSGEIEKAPWTYRYTAELFDFLETEIGIPYPWGDYKQVPVRDFLYAGMENTGATFFSDQYLVDSIGFNDANYINVNAHELAHQWFGNMVTETSASEHWLHEGFATFYAYQAESYLLGADLICWKLYDTARALEDMDVSGKGESLLDPGAGSLTFYEKGAWALYLLREEVGKSDFKEGVKKFLLEHSYSNATVTDFLRIVENVSGKSLEAFYKTWLEARDFPMDLAMAYLRGTSEPVNRYLKLREARKEGLAVDAVAVESAWKEYASPQYRAHVLKTFRPVLTPAFLEGVCREGTLPVQKAFLESTETLEDWMIPMVEAWLDAPSYDLREASLFRLWVASPGSRKSYLDQVSKNGSLTQMRLRQLWWLLAVFTEGYGDRQMKQVYLNNLQRTTASSYSWEVRENAFSMLREVGALSEVNLRDLMQATEHHTWQFKRFARRLLEALMEERPDPKMWNGLSKDFPREEYPYLHDKIKAL